MSAMWRDVRHAFRSLAAGPGFTVPTVLVLALGIGATTAIFSVVEHILFRPLPLAAAARVVTLCETHEGKGPYCSVSPPDAEDWAARSAALEVLGVARSDAVSARPADGGSVALVDSAVATPGFLRALGVRPLLGRSIEARDLPPRGDAHVVVLTWDAWQDQLGGDPEVLGRKLLLNDEPYRVIGVLPRAAYFPRLGHARLWTPLPFDPRDEETRSWRGFVAVGRLRPGTDVTRAEAELTAIEAGLAALHPETVGGWGVRVVPMREFLVRDARPMLLIFLAAAGLVLLIVCVNLAGLLLVRATSRRHEAAILLALGAGRGSIVWRLLAESALLGIAGGTLGVLLAVWATPAFVRMAPAGVPRLDEVTLDLPLLALALSVSLLSGLAAGLVPALRLARVAPAGALGEGRRSSTGRPTTRARELLVAGQLALAVVLLAAALLLLRSFAGLLDWRPGFETRHLLTFQVFPSSGRYGSAEEVLGLYRRVEEEIAALPGVAAVGTMSAGPIFGGDGTTPLLVDGRGDAVQDAPTAAWFDVGPGYFRTLGVPVVDGRGLREDDVAGRPRVAVVNETLARRLWPDRSPVDATVTLPQLQMQVRVVGVVRDVKSFFPGRPPVAEIYFSNRQYTRWATYFAVRTAVEPATLVGPVRATLERIDPDLQPVSLRTLAAAAADLRGEPRFQLVLVGLFAFVALVLGVAGVYGVMAYTARSRTHEIGVRIALGGRRDQVVRGVLRSGLRMLGAGVVLGLAGALAASRLLAGALYGVRPTDPVALSAAALLLFAAGLAAALGPALRAARTDPVRALREG